MLLLFEEIETNRRSNFTANQEKLLKRFDFSLLLKGLSISPHAHWNGKKRKDRHYLHEVESFTTVHQDFKLLAARARARSSILPTFRRKPTFIGIRNFTLLASQKRLLPSDAGQPVKTLLHFFHVVYTSYSTKRIALSWQHSRGFNSNIAAFSDCIFVEKIVKWCELWN